MTRKDSIIEEIHAVREALAREADYDLERMLEAARARQATSDLQSVTFSTRPNGPAEPSPGMRPKADSLGRKRSNTAA